MNRTFTVNSTFFLDTFHNNFVKPLSVCFPASHGDKLGTEKGLFQATREGKKVTLNGGYEQKSSLTPGKVMTIYMNNYNQLFVSYANKIIQIDGKEKNVVSTMLLNQDLPNGHIDCMIDDRNGNTWLGTNSGIITINNKNNSFYLYAFPEN